MIDPEILGWTLALGGAFSLSMGTELRWRALVFSAVGVALIVFGAMILARGAY